MDLPPGGQIITYEAGVRVGALRSTIGTSDVTQGQEADFKPQLGYVMTKIQLLELR